MNKDKVYKFDRISYIMTENNTTRGGENVLL